MQRRDFLGTNVLALTVAIVFLTVSAASEAASPVQPCFIQVVEAGTGWPVPLVELRTTHQVRFVTDNAGVIAFDLPEMMGRQTWFDVLSPGYEVPKDGFGLRGVRLTPQLGKTVKVEVNRTIVARRLGRITGAGIFAESQKLGRELDWRESGIVGCDSVQNAVHRRRLFWLWGDTGMPEYPLRIFDGTSATTAIRPLASFEPPLRLRLEYFTDAKGRPRGRRAHARQRRHMAHWLRQPARQLRCLAAGEFLREGQIWHDGCLRVGTVRVE